MLRGRIQQITQVLKRPMKTCRLRMNPALIIVLMDHTPEDLVGLIITHHIQLMHIRKKRLQKRRAPRCLPGSKANRTKLPNFRHRRHKRRINHLRVIGNQISLGCFQYMPSFQTPNHYLNLWRTSRRPIRLSTSIHCARKDLITYNTVWVGCQIRKSQQMCRGVSDNIPPNPNGIAPE